MIIKCTKYDLLQLPVKKGQIYFVTDFRVLYQDMGDHVTSRRNFPALVLNTENERTNKIRPENGRNYYVIQSNNLWTYDTKWVLRDGDVASYNTYVYDNTTGISPVVMTDPSLVLSNNAGDKIIDNNGLLGDGSVIIRDDNRISKGRMSVDNTRSEIAFTSYVDNGIRFYPYGLESNPSSKSNLGTLHLGIEAIQDPSRDGNLTRTGKAEYNGDFYFNGEVYLSQIADPTEYDVGYTPKENMTLTHSFTATKSKTASNGARYTEYNAFKINVLSDTAAKITVTTYTDDYNIAAQSDTGGMIYGGKFVWGSEIIYDAERTVVTEDDGMIRVTYKLIGDIHETLICLSGVPRSANSYIITFSNYAYTDDVNNVIGYTELRESVPLTSVLSKLGIAVFEHNSDPSR